MKNKYIFFLLASILLVIAGSIQMANAESKNRISVYLSDGIRVFYEEELDSITTSVSSDGKVVMQNFWHNGEKESFNVNDIDSICYMKPTLELSNGLEFGRVERGSKLHKTLAITNTGKYPATFKVVDFISSVFRCDSVEKIISIEPGSTYELGFVAEPNQEPGKTSSRISIESDNIADGKTDVYLYCDIIAPISKEEAQAQESTIYDIISGSVENSFSAAEQIALHKEEIEKLESVNELHVGNNATEVTYTNGLTIVYPYNYPSIFEYEGVTPMTVDKTQNEMSSVNTRAAQSGKKAAIFNLFHGDSKRKAQNNLILQAKKLLEKEYSLVEYYFGESFTYDKFASVINDPTYEIVYINTHGSDNGSCIQLGEKTDNPQIAYWQEDFFYEKEYYGTGYRYYRSAWMKDLFDKNDKSVFDNRLFIFATCNTLNNNYDDFYNKIGGCIVGWNGVNVMGQAYSTLLLHHLIDRRKGVDYFMQEFKKDGGLTDNRTGASFRVLGKSKNFKLESKNDIKSEYNTEYGELTFTNPKNGYCVSPSFFSGKADVKLNLSYYRYDETEWKLDLLGVLWDSQSNYYSPEGHRFAIHTYNFDDIDDYSSPLNIKKVCKKGYEYTAKGLKPGVYMLNTISAAYTKYDGTQSVEDENNLTSHDFLYLIIAGDYKENGSEGKQIPDVETLLVAKVNDEVKAAGSIGNMDGKNLSKGFLYWKDNESESSAQTVYSNTKASLYVAVLQNLSPNSLYKVRAFALDDDGNMCKADEVLEYKTDDSGSVGEHEYVDLGLPSGTLWATCNVGASKPEEYGDYFAWGETKPKDYYSWSYFDSDNVKKYSTTNNKDVLDLEDDAAYVNWGCNWRMPTREEQDELRGYCIWTWKAVNGVNGYNVVGPNGNSIFLPAAGYRDNTTSVESAGSHGNYWSSTFGMYDYYKSVCIAFESDFIDWAISYRSFGHSVRAVHNNKKEGEMVTTLEPHYLHVSIPGAHKKDLLSLRMDISEELKGKVKYHGYVVSTHPFAADKDYLSPFLNLNGTWDIFHGEEDVYVKLNNAQINVDGYVTYTNVYTGAIYELSSLNEKIYIMAYANTTDGEIIKGKQIEYTPHNPIEAPTKGSFVDLGVSVMWANCNFGGNEPTDYGRYYLYEQAQELFFESGTRLPTETEWDELEYKKTANLWIDNDDSSKIGVLYIGSNGNSIFCPYGGVEVNSSIKYAGEGYWYNSADTYWGYLETYHPDMSRDAMTIRLVKDNYTRANVVKTPSSNAIQTNSVPYKVSEMNGHPLPSGGSLKH